MRPASLFPIREPERCHCDVIAYDPGQFNLTLRAYREPEPGSGRLYHYYLFEFFFTVYFQGPFFWQGMTFRRGSLAEMKRLAPFAFERREQMRAEGRDHYPRLYAVESDLGPVRIIAGICRMYTHESLEPLSFHLKDGRWYADWPIVFEEGLPGSE